MIKFRNSQWASKVLRAKYFVILTDKEAVISFDGVNPEDFNDLMALRSQTVELELFKEKLDRMIHDHYIATRKLTKEMREATNKKTTKRTTKKATQKPAR